MKRKAIGDGCMKKIIGLLKIIITKYDMKHPEYTEPVFICPNIDTRNRCKNEKYKIPEDQPQCPIYHDNRCCGGCHLAATCEHCVNCNCFGFTYAQMGGTDKQCYKNILPDLQDGTFDKHLRKTNQDSSAHYGIMVAVPVMRDKYQEFEEPTPISEDISWKLEVIRPCIVGTRKKSLTELLFCMVRSGH